MAFLNSMSVVGSGLTAQQLRLDVISENITNQNTTRTEAGGPYRRKVVTLQSQDDLTPFQQALVRARGGRTDKGGVAVTAIEEDPSDFKLVYDPTNPDANAQGYVEMPWRPPRHIRQMSPRSTFSSRWRPRGWTSASDQPGTDGIEKRKQANDEPSIHHPHPGAAVVPQCGGHNGGHQRGGRTALHVFPDL